MHWIGWLESIQLQVKCSVLWLNLEDKSCGLSCRVFCGLFRRDCPVDKAQLQGEWSGSHQCPTGLTSYLASLSAVVFTSFFPWNWLCFLCPLTILSSWNGSTSPDHLPRVQLKVQLSGTTANLHFHLFSFRLDEKEGNFWVSRNCQLPFLTKWLRRLSLPNYPRIEYQNNSGCREIHWESMTVIVTCHNYWTCILEPESQNY